MEQVKIGDALFHGDPATEEKLRVKLSNTGWACAMCHPFASDTHPAQFPKWQEQMSKFATLRDMINWCIEKPNQGREDRPRRAGDEGARSLHHLVQSELPAQSRHALMRDGRPAWPGVPGRPAQPRPASAA